MVIPNARTKPAILLLELSIILFGLWSSNAAESTENIGNSCCEIVVILLGIVPPTLGITCLVCKPVRLLCTFAKQDAANLVTTSNAVWLPQGRQPSCTVR